MIKLLLVMSGGCLGAACRYGVNLLSVRMIGSGFPWGTLLVNCIGCLLIGLFFGLSERLEWLTPSVRIFFVTGFLGALTTFSSFAIETINTAQQGALVLAVLNLVANNAGALLFAVLGLWLAKAV